MSEVYFITARSVNRVKIGYAKQAQARFVSIRTHSPIEIELERVVKGTLQDEAALHERFANARTHGEWFDITDELEQHLQSLPRYEWKHRGWQHAARREAERAA